MAETYDVIVLGSGPGGYVAAIRCSQLGLKTAIVERELLGGICLNWGCIPTKALLRSAEILHYMQHAKDYGLVAEKIGADLDAVVKRSRGVAKQLNQGVTHLMKKNKIAVHMGEGKLTGKGKLTVTGKDGKAIALGEAEGFIKTVFDAKTGELLGAHMVGAEVTELIQGYTVGKTLETTEAELMETVFPHPTLSEMMHESVLAAYGRALHI